MTLRERIAASMVLAGAAALTAAAWAYGGPRAAVAVAGALNLGGGVLLGLDAREPLLDGEP